MDKIIESSTARDGAGHPYSKLLFIISIVVVALALAVGGYYGWKTYQARKLAKSPAPVSTEETVAETAEVTTENISSELEGIDVEELKAAVAELKSTLASFSGS